MIIDNWGLHGTSYRQGEAKLSKGYHNISVKMFENGGGASAYANWHDEKDQSFTPIHVYHEIP